MANSKIARKYNWLHLRICGKIPYIFGHNGSLMSDDYSPFEKRKQDHIELALMPANQADELNPFDSMTLVHEALPDFDFDKTPISYDDLTVEKTESKEVKNNEKSPEPDEF